MAGVGQHGGFALGKGVKTGLVHVQQPARHMAVNQMLRRAGVQQLCWHAVIQVQGTVNHHALDAHQHRYPRRLGRLLYGAGGSVLGAPDMDKIRGNFLSRAEKFSTLPVGTSAKLTPLLLQTVKVSARASTLATVMAGASGAAVMPPSAPESQPHRSLLPANRRHPRQQGW